MDELAKKASRKCLNCGSEVSGNYCQQCGQSASTGRITFKETLGHFLNSAFALEGQFFKTIRQLVVNPGRLFREFLAGKRKAFYKPVNLFVLLSALYILLRSAIGYDPLQGEMPQSPPPENRKIYFDASRFMVAHINNIMFFLAISIALWAKAFFRKRYNFTEYLSVGFYICCAYVLTGMALMIFSEITQMRFYSLQIGLLLFLMYYCLQSFLINKTFWVHVKLLFASLLALIFYMLFGYLFSLFFVYLFH